MNRRLGVFLTVVLVGCYYPGYQVRNREPVTSEVVVSGGEGTEVLAEGVAAITSSPDIARDQALRDALRKAVEQGVGSFINAETRVQNFQLLDDRIYSRANGYVSSYRVINESREGDIYRVVVRAKVKTDRIADDLTAIGILISEQGRPRLLVALEAPSPNNEIATAETELITIFTGRGFPVVDRQTVEKNINIEQRRRLIAGDSAAAQIAGLRTGAEIGIFGTLSLEQERKNVSGQTGEVDFYRVKLNLRAVDLQSAEVLGGSSMVRSLPFSPEAALKSCVQSSAESLMSRILNRWQRRENVTQIFCRNANYERLTQFKAELRNRVRGVKEIISREFSGNEALVEVITETPAQEIREELGNRGLNVRFNITGWSGNRIEIEFID
jgi:hypothetical protein